MKYESRPPTYKIRLEKCSVYVRECHTIFLKKIKLIRYFNFFFPRNYKKKHNSLYNRKRCYIRVQTTCFKL